MGIKSMANGKTQGVVEVSQLVPDRSDDASTPASPPGRRVKVVMLMWWIPHYRAPIFRRLSQSPQLDFVVWAGNNRNIARGQQVATAEDVGVANGISWRPIRSRRLRRWPLRDLEWQPEVLKLAWREDIDVLMIHGITSVSNWLVRVICKLRRIPLVEWSHGAFRPQRGLRWRIRKFYMKWADAFLLYGRFACNFFVAQGFDAGRVFLINNSLDYDRQVIIRDALTEDMLRETRASFGVGHADERLIFHCGRFRTKKTLRLLIDAIRILKERQRKVVAVLIGDGADEAGLRRYAEGCGLSDRVVFCGPVYDEERLGRIIAASDLCVVPASLGLTAMHSMVYGTPVLTCDNSGWVQGPEFDAVIDGENGILFRWADLDDLVRKMDAALYPVPCKPAMAQACRDTIAREFTPSYQERVVLKMINSLVPAHKQVRVPP
ncbi:MAG: glycosyltransferase family 4 protein [Planctomycetes bacterium]|nr:glycosyltransferase family 4 protein [Planctomycetota bacterium]